MQDGQVYRAASVQEAIRLAKAELGPDALILDVRRIAPADPRVLRSGTVEVRAIAARQNRDDAVPPSEHHPHQVFAAPRRATPGALQFRALQALQRMGWSETLAQRALEAYVSAQRWPPSQRRTLLAQALRRAVRLTTVVPATSGRPLILGFYGPSGSGKTLTILKLATQLTQDRRSVTVLGLGLASPHQQALNVWAEHLNLRVIFTDSRAGMRQICETTQSEILLVDTPGCNPFDQRSLKQLRDLLGSDGPGACYLVLPLTMDVTELIEMAERFQLVNPTGLVCTRLDETRRLGVAIGLAEQSGLPLAALSTGIAVPGDLVAATPEILGELALWTLSRLLPGG